MDDGTQAAQPDEEWAESQLGEESTEDICEILGEVEIFGMLKDSELLEVERLVHHRTYLPQETIVRQGAPGVGMYIIKRGSTDVLLEGQGEQLIRLASLTDGMVFGEMSLLDGAPRAASVVATERSEIMGFLRADLMDLIARMPKLGFRIAYSICECMSRRFTERLTEYRTAEIELYALQNEAAAASATGDD